MTPPIPPSPPTPPPPASSPAAEAEKRASFEREALVHLDSLYRVALRLTANPAEDPQGTFFDRIVDDEVLRAIDTLPEQFRETVVLSDVEGMSYEEIARVLEVPVGTVKSRLFRARRLLQQKLYDYAVGMGYIRGAAK